MVLLSASILSIKPCVGFRSLRYPFRDVLLPFRMIVHNGQIKPHVNCGILDLVFIPFRLIFAATPQPNEPQRPSLRPASPFVSASAERKHCCSVLCCHRGFNG
jgi:hypothetical protein